MLKFIKNIFSPKTPRSSKPQPLDSFTKNIKALGLNENEKPIGDITNIFTPIVEDQQKLKENSNAAADYVNAEQLTSSNVSSAAAVDVSEGDLSVKPSENKTLIKVKEIKEIQTSLSNQWEPVKNNRAIEIVLNQLQRLVVQRIQYETNPATRIPKPLEQLLIATQKLKNKLKDLQDLQSNETISKEYCYTDNDLNAYIEVMIENELGGYGRNDKQLNCNYRLVRGNGKDAFYICNSCCKYNRCE